MVASYFAGLLSFASRHDAHNGPTINSDVIIPNPSPISSGNANDSIESMPVTSAITLITTIAIQVVMVVFSDRVNDCDTLLFTSCE
jgi:hypothetical protein